MNRASLLHILDHAGGISEAEVRELEQLAAAFPYCQTAHLLLAKAAYDRGSMLANQRLRRAATYAADRELLRQLIELPPQAAGLEQAAPAPEPGPAEAVEPATSPAEDLLAAATEPAPDVALGIAPLAEPEPPAPAELRPEPMDVPPTTEPAAATPDVPAEAAHIPTDWPAAESPLAEVPTVEALAPAVSTTELSAADAVAPEVVETVPQLAAEAEGPSDEATEPGAPAEAAAGEPGADEPVAPAQPDLAALVAGLAVVEAAGPPPAADELPAEALPIRPPVEAGSSRFEFGLGEAPEPDPAYQLPELPTEPAAGSVPPFRADEQLAYALAAGSRFGSALTLRSALTEDVPSAPDWQPDALLLAHAAAHRPAAAPAPSSLALIDKFLRSQPRIKSAATRPAPTDAPQADLSVRSTSAAPSLASESLAKILVKQGKTARAIEIYEQLMQRQPEKKAYFAAQIDLLNQQPE